MALTTAANVPARIVASSAAVSNRNVAPAACNRSVSASGSPGTDASAIGNLAANAGRKPGTVCSTSSRSRYRDACICSVSSNGAGSRSTRVSIGTAGSYAATSVPIRSVASGAERTPSATSIGEAASSPWNSPNCHWRVRNHRGSRTSARRLRSKSVMRGRPSRRFQPCRIGSGFRTNRLRVMTLSRRSLGMVPRAYGKMCVATRAERSARCVAAKRLCVNSLRIAGSPWK